MSKSGVTTYLDDIRRCFHVCSPCCFRTIELHERSAKRTRKASKHSFELSGKRLEPQCRPHSLPSCNLLKVKGAGRLVPCDTKASSWPCSVISQGHPKTHEPAPAVERILNISRATPEVYRFALVVSSLALGCLFGGATVCVCVSFSYPGQCKAISI